MMTETIAATAMMVVMVLMVATTTMVRTTTMVTMTHCNKTVCRSWIYLNLIHILEKQLIIIQVSRNINLTITYYE
jgi:hypothetical protein